jgi:DNA-3-methyladenine glycosylase II
MTIDLPVSQPFSFAQTLAFVRRFQPCQNDYLLTDDSLTAAVAIGGRPVPFTIRSLGADAGGDHLTVEVADAADSAHASALLQRASDLIGARDEVAELYARAEGDPPFQALVAQLHGLHHVRFLTLEEIAVYCVMMQRTPVTVASAYKRRFLHRFGFPVAVGGHTLRAMPEMRELLRLDADAIADAIGHRRKAEQIVSVVRGVAAIGEPFLRTAPYARARDALLAVPGIGPFSATAILLRGLGRMDELPVMSHFADEARALYGAAYDEAAIARRYGRHIGYWSFYLKSGVARLRPASRATPRAPHAPSPRSPRSARRSPAHGAAPSRPRRSPARPQPSAA